MEECEPETQRKGKEILIQEVEGQDDIINDEAKGVQTGERVKHFHNQYDYL